MRYAARVDANQAEIVAFMRANGATVWIIGLPVDLLVGHCDETALVEVKVLEGKRAPKAAAHTKLQKAFMLDWCGGLVATVTDVEGALKVLQTMEALNAARHRPG